MFSSILNMLNALNMLVEKNPIFACFSMLEILYNVACDTNVWFMIIMHFKVFGGHMPSTL